MPAKKVDKGAICPINEFDAPNVTNLALYSIRRKTARTFYYQEYANSLTNIGR